MGGALTDIERARELVLERATPRGSERVPLEAAAGRFLAEPATASDPVPPFDGSAMDGYAVRAADVAAAPVELELAGEARAGMPSERALGPGQAITISTGAVIPGGADAVVRVEDTSRAGERVRIEAPVPRANNIRRAGEDIAAGERVLGAGIRLGPAELGVLASIGASDPVCARRPRVAVLSTGDELRGPGEPLGPGEIRNSNALTVPALADRSGAAPRIETRRLPDDPEATRAGIEAALDADLVAVCGGVSVGPHDHVKGAFDELGVERIFWGVSLKPGKPTYFGVRGETLVFGLPGNPVSAFVTFLLFARPALRAMQGADPGIDRITATLASAYEKPADRAHAVRCTLRPGPGGWEAAPAPRQGSHVLSSMVGMDGLALIAAETERVEAGAPVTVELIERN